MRYPVQQQPYEFLLFYCPGIGIKPLVIQAKQNVIVYWSEIRKTCEILEGKKIYTLVQNNSLPSLFLEQHDNICINSCSDFAINYFVDKRILTKYLI